MSTVISNHAALSELFYVTVIGRYRFTSMTQLTEV